MLFFFIILVNYTSVLVPSEDIGCCANIPYRVLGACIDVCVLKS